MLPLEPARLRPYYRAFLGPRRILLTGHSHQAWPDVAREGLLASFDDAALRVDEKWERAFAAADELRRTIGERIGTAPDTVALGSNTHELAARFLSALDLAKRPHLVATAGEFHSLHRQLLRLREAGVRVTLVPTDPLESLATRLAAEVREDTAALLASTVLFETSALVPDLKRAVAAAHAQGAQVLLDAYHAFGAVPFSVADFGPEPIFLVAGGYKYAQWGEGCCFLRVPPGCALRPVFTGWFSDFAHLDAMRGGAAVEYGPRGADRFAGSTYDPSSHYRARAVNRFFAEQGLTLPRLRALSLRQTRRLMDGLPGARLLTPRADAARAGFVALRHPQAGLLAQRLRAEGVWVDARGDVLRLGPAPYVLDAEIDEALARLNELLATVGSP